MKTLSHLKLMLFTLITFNLSLGVAAIPNEQTLARCSNKIEKSLIRFYQTLGYSRKIAFLEKAKLVSYRHYKNGSIVGEFSTAPLAEAQQDGYYQSTGAIVLAGFTGKSCQLLEIRLSTGFEQNLQISVDQDPFHIKLIE